MSELKKPLKSVIKAGYAMTRWRKAECEGEYSDEYRDDAIKYTRKATKQLMAATRHRTDGSRVYELHGAVVLEILYSAASKLSDPAISYWDRMAAANSIGRAHAEASEVNRMAGYRPPSDEEFDELGGGGGR